ncbi:MAG: AAA family ATPase, partial [Candidatus Cloacimonetes bacterium]|nr:AAA family ATPase [Candidatus Cloacimonadota bacterium]
MVKEKIELNKEFCRALDLMEGTSKNVFVTGRAGTGKSTLLRYFRKITKKNVAVLAPTGVAAVNIKGQTIHSFFGFRPDITPEMVRKKYVSSYKKDLYQKLDSILIDEISMVRADLLDCVDTFLRLNGPERNRPFGGVQMIFIGDLYQLPPVVTAEEKMLFAAYYQSPYFFDSKAWQDLKVEFVFL